MRIAVRRRSVSARERVLSLRHRRRLRPRRGRPAAPARPSRWYELWQAQVRLGGGAPKRLCATEHSASPASPAAVRRDFVQRVVDLALGPPPER